MNQKQIDELIDAHHSGDSEKVSLLLSELDVSFFPFPGEFFALVPKALNRDEFFIRNFSSAWVWKDDTGYTDIETLSKIMRWDELDESDKQEIAEKWWEYWTHAEYDGYEFVKWKVVTSSSNVSVVIAVSERHQLWEWIRAYGNENEMREALGKEFYIYDD